jgi:hypothetical protein
MKSRCLKYGFNYNYSIEKLCFFSILDLTLSDFISTSMNLFELRKPDPPSGL